jgi:hypothetical protein
MNNLKATVIISSKLVVGMYTTSVSHFLHLFYIQTGSVRRRWLIGCVQEYYCFIKTAVSNFCCWRNVWRIFMCDEILWSVGKWIVYISGITNK